MKSLVGLYSFVLLLWAVKSNSLNSVSSDPCHIAAWVRAPDLDPGQIIPGQVRIKANGTCDPISEYSLILRFKERAWAKLPKPDITLPQEPERMYGNISKIDWNSVFRSSESALFFYFSDPLRENYTENMSDPSLWDVTEEERIAFESRYRLNKDITPFSLGEALTHDFAILVPTTNYPPTLWSTFFATTATDKSDTVKKGHEHIYIYTVEIKFDNGTTIEVPAGYTAFKSAGRNDNSGPEVITANFTQRFPSSDDLNVSLTINITFPHGRTLEQGSTHNLTFTIYDRTVVPDGAQTNYSLTLGPPVIYIQTSSRDRWIQTLSPMNNYTISSQGFLDCQLHPTSFDDEWTDLCYLRPFEEAEADTSTWNISTFKSLQIAPKGFPSFDMHHESFESQLSIFVPIVHLRETKYQTQVFDEEYYWVPATVAEPENNFFRSLTTEDIPITISPNVKPSIPVVRYLSSHARRPLFIDQSTIEGLSQLSVEERDLLAPKSTPIIKRNTENVVWQRYYDASPYYVGDTWHRKVLNGASQSDGSDRDGSLNTLLVQVSRN